MKLRFFLLFVLVIATIASSFAATLQWDENSDATYYEAYYRIEGGTDWTAFEANPITDTSVEIPEMETYNQNYEFSVRAFNECGNSSDYSDVVTYNTCTDEVLDQPINLKVVISVQVTTDTTTEVVTDTSETTE